MSVVLKKKEIKEDKLRRLIEKRGLKERLSVGMVKRIPEDKLKEMHAKHFKLKEMAEELGVSITTVSNLRAFYGLTKKRIPQPKFKPFLKVNIETGKVKRFKWFKQNYRL